MSLREPRSTGSDLHASFAQARASSICSCTRARSAVGSALGATSDRARRRATRRTPRAPPQLPQAEPRACTWLRRSSARAGHDAVRVAEGHPARQPVRDLRRVHEAAHEGLAHRTASANPRSRRRARQAVVDRVEGIDGRLVLLRSRLYASGSAPNSIIKLMRCPKTRPTCPHEPARRVPSAA